ncbi:MAG: alpha/beta hydrolase fold domain-containing protein [Pseudomonadota bacterium]
MPGFARKTGAAVSEDAKKRIAALKPYPSLDMWRNPVTRGFARKLLNDDWRTSVDEIDFEYRLSDASVGGVDGAHYETASSREGAPVILYIHGGGFVAGDPIVCASLVLPICFLTGGDGFGPAYSLLPEATYPVQIDEASDVWNALYTDYPEKRYVLLADSTGAAIALSALMRWRDAGWPLPSAAVFLSPCVDGKGASDTQITLDGRDPLIKSMRGAYMRNLFRYYAPDAQLEDPGVSPIYGDFSGLPPMLVHAGSREVMLGDAARLSASARRVGVDARLQIYDGMYHRFHANWSLAETREAHRDIADFIGAL